MVASLFVGLLWLLALTGFIGYRLAVAATCSLLLVTRVWPLVAMVVSTIATFSLLKADSTPTLAFASEVLAYLATAFAFRAAAAGPGLASWQAGAAGAAWIVMGSSSQGLLGLLLLALVLVRTGCTRAEAGGRDERRFATFLGVMLASGALWNGRGRELDWLSWLLPVAPLLVDAALSALRRWRHSEGSPVRVSALIAQASGRWQTAGIVLFVLSLGWYGLAAWWGRTAQYSVPLTSAVVSVPVVCVWLAVSMAAHPAPAKVVADRTALLGTQRIPGLDGLRAIAVALVVFSHAGLIEGGIWEASGVAQVLNAQVGVQIFFVLSGLLITCLLLAEHARSGRVDLPRFYLRRLLRIFPVYYAAISVSLVLTTLGIYRIHPEAFGAAAVYVMNFASWDRMEATFSHFWSLAVEEHFYFFWPLAVMLAAGRARGASMIAGLAILVMTWWLADPPGFVVALARSHAVGRWTVPAALPILVGCLAACLLWRRTLAPTLVRMIGLGGLLLFLLPVVPAVQSRVPAALGPLLSSAAIAAMMASLICAPRSWAVRLLELRPLAYLGTISYGIYVWQGILTGNGPYRAQPGWPPEPLLGAVLAVAVAAISYRFFEAPILRYKDLLDRPGRRQA